MAYEEAEAAYRAALSETEKLLQRGGSAVVPQNIKNVATGPFLDELKFFLSDYKKLGDRRTGVSVITRFLRQGYEPDELLLVACTDGRDIAVFDKTGKLKSRGRAFVYDLVARAVSGQWKIYSAEARKDSTCPS